MGKFNKIVGSMIAVAAITSVPARAGTFVLTSSSNSALSGTPGNAFAPASVGGITLTATAWSTDTLSTTPEAAYLGRYVNGLGVTNTNEGNGNSYNSHTVDNIGSYDFIRLTFSTSVQLTGMTLYGYDVDGTPRTIDTDAWVSYGSTGLTTTTDWQGYLNRGFSVSSGTALSTGAVGTVWLIGAARSPGERNDGFKLSSVSAVGVPVSGVPEPATWMMMILGFGMIGGVMRRRSTALVARRAA